MKTNPSAVRAQGMIPCKIIYLADFVSLEMADYWPLSGHDSDVKKVLAI